MVGTKFGEYSLTKRFDKQRQSRVKYKKKIIKKNL
jgi:ribosomal protein S19